MPGVRMGGESAAASNQPVDQLSIQVLCDMQGSKVPTSQSDSSLLKLRTKPAWQHTDQPLQHVAALWTRARTEVLQAISQEAA